MRIKRGVMLVQRDLQISKRVFFFYDDDRAKFLASNLFI